MNSAEGIHPSSNYWSPEKWNYPASRGGCCSRLTSSSWSACFKAMELAGPDAAGRWRRKAKHLQRSDSRVSDETGCSLHPSCSQVTDSQWISWSDRLELA